MTKEKSKVKQLNVNQKLYETKLNTSDFTYLLLIYTKEYVKLGVYSHIQKYTYTYARVCVRGENKTGTGKFESIGWTYGV